MDYYASVYDFSKIKYIHLLADVGKLIKTVIHNSNAINNVKFSSCTFHFIQTINKITTES